MGPSEVVNVRSVCLPESFVFSCLMETSQPVSFQTDGSGACWETQACAGVNPAGLCSVFAVLGAGV